MTIDEIQTMLAGRGKSYTAEEVARCMDIYGDIIPQWYADLWTSAAIFDADMYVYEKELEDEAWAKISVLRLDGPDDGWKKDDQSEMIRAGYFSLGMWQSYAYWVIAPSRSTSQDAPVNIIDHEIADDMDEITDIEGITTFQQLLNSVVNFPILQAIDKWKAFAERESSETENQQEQNEEDYNFWQIMKALEGEYPEPVELDEDDLGLPKGLLEGILSRLRSKKKRWDSLIGPLPYYERDEIPLALRYVWEHMEIYPHCSWQLQRGTDLLRSISAASERGIPHHLFVVGQQEEQFITLDLTRPGEFDDCPVMTWPAGQELAPSLGEWLLTQNPQ